MVFDRGFAGPGYEKQPDMVEAVQALARIVNGSGPVEEPKPPRPVAELLKSR